MSNEALMVVGNSTLSISTAFVANYAEATLKAAAYTPMNGLNSLPDVGDEDEIIAFETIEDNRRHKLPGVRDAGDAEIVCGFLSDDPGQNAARVAAAETPKKLRGFKLTIPDGSSTYFAGYVTSAKQNMGATGDAIKATFKVAITSGVYFVNAV